MCSILLIVNFFIRRIFIELKKHFKLYKSGKIGRTIPFRVDTLNNKSANSRGCFSFLVIPQQKN
ncbi:KxYKxGKxW signal peptide domain-containing protein [Limosilactobacillus reuteri]|uniref:KxYKxGKxW signal peptide domain-containing protein n=1 Tax=Limosilactobacillus reuteri TaxID=1598 RepID=UPI00124AD46A|nr:hypothetical protein [Limosilactobacillus reuteri]MRI08646.1 hypothetical protein [Limosilactobacillus reuteri]